MREEEGGMWFVCLGNVLLTKLDTIEVWEICNELTLLIICSHQHFCCDVTKTTQTPTRIVMEKKILLQ